MINQAIEKAYDIIIENQRNADTKANIFIVLLTGFLAFIGQIPISFIENTSLEVFTQVYLIMLVPLVMFIISLIPITNQNYRVRRKTSKKIPLNIFLWKSIIQFDSENDFINEFIRTHQLEFCNEIDRKMLQQIYVNSMILEYKYSAQKLAYAVIIQFLLVLLSSAISLFTIRNNHYVTLVILIMLELMLYCNRYISKIVIKVYKYVKSIKINKR